MMRGRLKLPKEIIFGAGKRFDLPALLPEAPLLVLSGNHLADEEITAITGGRPGLRLRGLPPEAPLPAAGKALAAARKCGAQAVVAIGGGSVIDLGKTVAALLPLPGGVEDYFYGRRTIPGKGVFFAALPTTAGTGAEVTPNAVLLDPATGVKQSLRHPSMFADLALVDPELLCGCPRRVLGASGFDALTQAIESYLSCRATTVSRILAYRAIRHLRGALLPAWQNSTPELRESLARGSMLAGMAMVQSGLGAVHGLAHPIGSLLAVPHGVACAVLLPEVLRFNREFTGPLARQLFGCSADAEEQLIASLEELRRKLELPEDFRAGGLERKHFDFILRNCRSGSMAANPRPMSDADVTELLEKLS